MKALIKKITNTAEIQPTSGLFTDGVSLFFSSSPNLPPCYLMPLAVCQLAEESEPTAAITVNDLLRAVAITRRPEVAKDLI